MAISCQYTKECTLEVSHECINESLRLFFCNSHLIEYISENGKMQNVKSVNIPVSETVRSTIIEKLHNLCKQTIQQFQIYQTQIKNFIKNLVDQQTKVQLQISALLSDLQQLIHTTKSTELLKTFKKYSEFHQLLIEAPESLQAKLEKLEICKIAFTKSNEIPTLKIRNHCKKLLGKKIFTESKCPNDHSLLLSLDSTSYYNFPFNTQEPPKCDFCATSINIPSLHCRICNFDVCEDCQESKNFLRPEEIKCSLGHLMVFFKDVSNKLGTLVCNLCSAEYKTHGWRCELCDFDICENCAKMKGIQPYFEYPFKCCFRHRLVLGIETKEFLCGFCEGQSIGVVWKCDSCKVKFCKECVQKIGHKVPLCINGHEMFHKVIKGKKLWEKKIPCKRCQNSLDDFGFICINCDYTYCEKCFLINHKVI